MGTLAKAILGSSLLIAIASATAYTIPYSIVVPYSLQLPKITNIYGLPLRVYGSSVPQNFTQANYAAPAIQYGPPTTTRTPVEPASEYGPPVEHYPPATEVPAVPALEYGPPRKYHRPSTEAPAVPAPEYGPPNTHGILTRDWLSSQLAALAQLGNKQKYELPNAFEAPSTPGIITGSGPKAREPSTIYGAPANERPITPASEYGVPQVSRTSFSIQRLPQVNVAPAIKYGPPSSELPAKPVVHYGLQNGSNLFQKTFFTEEQSEEEGEEESEEVAEAPQEPFEVYGPPKIPSTSYGVPGSHVYKL